MTLAQLIAELDVFASENRPGRAGGKFFQSGNFDIPVCRGVGASDLLLVLGQGRMWPSPASELVLVPGPFSNYKS